LIALGVEVLAEGEAGKTGFVPGEGREASFGIAGVAPPDDPDDKELDALALFGANAPVMDELLVNPLPPLVPVLPVVVVTLLLLLFFAAPEIIVGDEIFED